MIILRIANGIRDHFPSRVTEWIMTLPLLGWAIVLAFDPGTFATSPSFTELARYGSQHMWATICFVTWAARLIALIVNGTFKPFRYSPHLRGGASVMAGIFWMLIAIATTISFAAAGGAGTAVAAYGTLFLIEIWNLVRAWADIGASQRSR